MSATILEMGTVTSGTTLSGSRPAAGTGEQRSLLGRLVGRATAGAARTITRPAPTAPRGRASKGPGLEPRVATAETAAENHGRSDRPSSFRRIASGTLRGLRTRRRTGFGA